MEIMTDVIHKIFLKEFDEEVHNSLVKFSKGTFDNKYLIEAKKQKDKWSIKTSAEYTNYLVSACLQRVSGEIDVTGVIVATFNIQDKVQFPIERIKQFMGVKQAVVNTKTTPDKIISLMNEFPKAFYALSFSDAKFQLKIKAKAPKSAKPAASSEKEVSANFCSLKTSDAEIIKDILFDVPNFNEARAKHTILINDIILPKGVEDPAELRKKAKRKGIVKRELVVDGNKSVREAEFEA